MSESQWRRTFRLGRDKVEHDVDDEVAFHYAMRVEQFIAQGMSRSDAERAASEQFGDVRNVRSELVDIGRRAHRRRDWRDRWDGIRIDLVVALRALRREPLFTFGVVATLGLGIGANATMFAIIDRLMLSGPSHVVDARQVNRLYLTTNSAESGVHTGATVGYVTFALLRDRGTSFAAVGAYRNPFDLRLGTGPEVPSIPVASVTWELFGALGVRPLLGRFFDKTEDGPQGGKHVVVIGERLWRSELGGDQSVLGRRITLGDNSYTVIGVAPAGFTGPERVRSDAWIPLTLDAPRADLPTTYQAQWLRVVARLKPGVSAKRASSEATTILRGAYNGPDPEMRRLVASVRPLWYGPNGEPTGVANVSRWLMGVAGAVFLITCANVANLLVARMRRRRAEIAVRLALG